MCTVYEYVGVTLSSLERNEILNDMQGIGLDSLPILFNIYMF